MVQGIDSEERGRIDELERTVRRMEETVDRQHQRIAQLERKVALLLNLAREGAKGVYAALIKEMGVDA